MTQAAATVALTNLSQTYDGTPKSATVTTTPNGLSTSVTYNGSATAPTNAGSYAVVATITDPNYSGSASGTLVITKANQTITFAALANKTFGDPPFTVSATATSGLAVTFAVGASDKCTIAGATVTLTGAGSCTVTASQAGDANYNAAAPVAQSFTIAPAAATVTLNGLSQTYDGTPRVVTATTSPAGLTVDDHLRRLGDGAHQRRQLRGRGDDQRSQLHRLRQRHTRRGQGGPDHHLRGAGRQDPRRPRLHPQRDRQLEPGRQLRGER